MQKTDSGNRSIRKDILMTIKEVHNICVRCGDVITPSPPIRYCSTCIWETKGINVMRHFSHVPDHIPDEQVRKYLQLRDE